MENKDQDGSKKRKMVVAVGYCKFYPIGKCKKGTGCPFYHELPPPGQESKRISTEKSKGKNKETSKIVPKDRTKLLELVKLFMILISS
jgi:hypothetical protein